MHLSSRKERPLVDAIERERLIREATGGCTVRCAREDSAILRVKESASMYQADLGRSGKKETALVTASHAVAGALSSHAH